MNYSAYVISSQERRRLLGLFPPTRAIIRAHHITYVIGSSKVPPSLPTMIVGVCDHAGSQVLVCEVGGNATRSDGNTYHITWSHDVSVLPSNSNWVLRNYPWEPLKHTLVLSFPKSYSP